MSDILGMFGAWSVQLWQAARTKSQQQHANILGHAAFLDAGLRHLDQRFVELFVPLTIMDGGAWPVDRRRARADEILTFITSADVIPRLATSIQWLEASPFRDPHVQALTDALCATVREAVWAEEIREVPARSEEFADETWLERAKGGPAGDIAAMRPTDDMAFRGSVDADDATLPVVKELIRALRSGVPDEGLIERLAGAVLVRPGNFTSSPRRWSLDDVPLGDTLGPPTISPLRDWADVADGQFATLLHTVQQSFPGIPAPEWMWRL